MQNSHIENAIAISADFHTHKAYDQFYKMFCDRLGGFCGIYDLIAQMTKALTALEKKTPDIWNDCVYNLDWQEFIEFYVNFFITESIKTYQLPEVKSILERVKNLRR